MEPAHVSFKARIAQIHHITIVLFKSCFAEIMCLTFIDFLYVCSQAGTFIKLFISSDVCFRLIKGFLSNIKNSHSSRFSNDLSVVGLIGCQVVTRTVKLTEFQPCGSNIIFTPVELHQ